MTNKTATICLSFLISCSLLTGCQTATTQEIDSQNYVSPEVLSIAEQHTDIYLPLDAEWERTLYSGSVEQHEFDSKLDTDAAKAEMSHKGWLLEEEKENVLRFTKEELRVSYTIHTNGFTLFIEPIDLYGNK